VLQQAAEVSGRAVVQGRIWRAHEASLGSSIRRSITSGVSRAPQPRIRDRSATVPAMGSPLAAFGSCPLSPPMS
jgi:hypothetical protein